MNYKDQYKCLLEINKKLRAISSIYYIMTNGIIIMNPLVPFIEKFAILNNDILSEYRGLAFLPNAFAEFGKKTTKNNLIGEMYEDNIILKNEKDNAYSITITRCLPKNEESFIENLCDRVSIGSRIIIPPNITQNVKNTISTSAFIPINQDMVLSLYENQIITHLSENNLFSMTKQLFGSLKKTGNLEFARLNIIDEKVPNKFYILFREYDEDISIFTLCAYLDI